jgi:hypothetical protein
LEHIRRAIRSRQAAHLSLPLGYRGRCQGLFR